MVRFDLYQGSLLEVPEVEAVVIPANRQLTLGWGSHLAEQVLARCGKQLEQEALREGARQAGVPLDQFRGLALGEAVRTSAPSLPFRHLIHAAVLDRYDFNPLFLLKLRQRTSDETLSRAVAASARLAAQAGVRALGLSPMGAGIGGMPTAKCARLSLQALRELDGQGALGPLSRVVFAMPKPSDIGIFRQELERSGS